MNYSVLLLYPDYATDIYGQDTYLSWIPSVDSVEEAITAAQIEAVKINNKFNNIIIKPEDFFVLLVAEGYISDINSSLHRPGPQQSWKN